MEILILTANGDIQVRVLWFHVLSKIMNIHVGVLYVTACHLLIHLDLVHAFMYVSMYIHVCTIFVYMYMYVVLHAVYLYI